LATPAPGGAQAAGKYDTGSTPKIGSVLSFKPTARMNLGHVAFVSQVLTDRVIQVTHANWSIIEGDRGQIEKDVTVVDVSPAGDWTQVKVWYDPIRDLGTSVYPTNGFIYQDAQATRIAVATSKIAMAQNAVVSAAKQAANQVAVVGAFVAAGHHRPGRRLDRPYRRSDRSRRRWWFLERRQQQAERPALISSALT
jgi:surface antigen